MKTTLALLALLLTSASTWACTAKTLRLDEPDAAPSALDGSSPECTVAEDCPGNARPCNEASCGCGTFKLCQQGRCLQASAECPRDASVVDTGFADAGMTGCTQASDCVGSAESVEFCPNAAYSCVASSCLWECQGGRTCELPALGDCIACGGARACPGQMCGFVDWGATIEDVTSGCEVYPGTAKVLRGAKAKLFSTARPCSTAIEIEDVPRLVGTFIEYDDFRYVGHFPDLGGTCTGEQAPTGAIRFIFNCPLCQFVVGP